MRELGEAPPPGRLREALAPRARGPGTHVAYWLPAQARYVDVAGRPVGLPEPDAPRVATVACRDARAVLIVRDDGRGGADPARGSGLARAGRPGGRAGRQAGGRQPGRRRDRAERRTAVRVVLTDDSVLLREGVARLLGETGFDVIGLAADAAELLDLVGERLPDVAVVDIRMPPTTPMRGCWRRGRSAPAIPRWACSC